MLSQDRQTQLFQAALIIVGMTCLLASPRQASGARNGMATNSSCPPNLRVVQVSPDSALNLRRQPNGEILDQLAAGQSVYVEAYDASGAWVRVVLEDGGDRGWVFNQYLGRQSGCPDTLG